MRQEKEPSCSLRGLQGGGDAKEVRQYGEVVSGSGHYVGTETNEDSGGSDHLKWGRLAGPLTITRITEEDGSDWIVIVSPKLHALYETESKYRIEDVEKWSLRIATALQAENMPLIFSRLRAAQELCQPKPSKEVLDQLQDMALQGTGADKVRTPNQIAADKIRKFKKNGKVNGRHTNARLTDEQAMDVYTRRVVGKEPLKAVAADFDINPVSVHNIASKLTYGHIHVNGGVQRG